MYQMITLGGDAELELVDSLDPFSEGILFSVRPPKKSWKNISNLSGGEKVGPSLPVFLSFFETNNLLRHWALWHSSLPCTTTNPRHCMSWMRSMQLWISRMCPSWPTISRNVPGMLNSLSSLSAITCLSWPTVSLVYLFHSFCIISKHIFEHTKIYKTEDCTKSVTINPSKFATPAMRSVPA